MIGKRSSLRILLRCLRILGVSHVFSTRFLQGKKGKSTVRWGVAWTFLSVQVPPSIQYNMSHKVFGLKKLRQRRDVSTEVRSISITDFLSTIDPKEILHLTTFSQQSQQEQFNFHSFDYVNFVEFMKTRADLTVLPPTERSPSSSSNRWSDCTGLDCIFALSFLRIWTSVSHHSSFIFHRVDEGEMKRNSRSKTLEFVFLLNEISSSVELCISLTAHVIMREEYKEGHCEKRRRNSDAEQPVSKRTRTESVDTRWETSSIADSEIDDDESESEAHCLDEWQHSSCNDQEAKPTYEVSNLEFSISLNQLNQNPSDDLATVISPSLRLTSPSLTRSHIPSPMMQTESNSSPSQRSLN